MTGPPRTDGIGKTGTECASWVVGREFQSFDVHGKAIRTFSDMIGSGPDPLRQKVPESFSVGDHLDGGQTGLVVPETKFERLRSALRKGFLFQNIP